MADLTKDTIKDKDIDLNYFLNLMRGRSLSESLPPMPSKSFDDDEESGEDTNTPQIQH